MKDQLEKYIKTLHIAEDCKYLIFVDERQFTKVDLHAMINNFPGRKDIMFVCVNGNPNDIIKTIELPK